MTIFNQAEYEIRCEWGENGVAQLAPISDVVIIVDVLSFSTCVDIAVGRGAIIYPYPFQGTSAADVGAYAVSLGAEAAMWPGTKYSPRPHSLLQIPSGTRLVLPSPNGSALTLATGDTPTFTGCLRNYRAVAAAAQKLGRRIAVVPAGERWKDDGSLRPAQEDWIGAGAVIGQIMGDRSPEAAAAAAAFEHVKEDVGNVLRRCSSGKELMARHFESSVSLAVELDVSDCAPIFTDNAYRDG